MTLEACFIAIAYLTVTALIAAAVGTAIMARHLKVKFPTSWQAEGNPEKWLTLQTCPVSGHVLGFLDERRYLATGSSAFIHSCNTLRILWRIALILFGGTLVAGAIWASSNG